MTVSSLLIFMIVLFLALAIFLGTPIAVALGLAAVAELILQGEVPLMIAAQRIFNGVNSVTLMGIPFFMLVGSIMERSGITQKLIDFANSLVGWLRGGLCYVGVLTGILMGGISGSAPADTAALSSIMVPSMERSGYDREFSAALMASSGTLGIIIPPSMPMIVLASITGISVGKLFLGGIIPGCMIGLSFMIICGVTCHIRGYDKDHKIRLSLREIGRTFFHALLPILAPVIIVGGILTGIVTATESAIAAVAYTCFDRRTGDLHRDDLSLARRVHADDPVLSDLLPLLDNKIDRRRVGLEIPERVSAHHAAGRAGDGVLRRPGKRG